MHILFVDDNRDTLNLFSMAFVLAGHRVSTASSGTEAFELLSKHHFDAVLLDIEMPNLSGWQVLELIRELPFQSQIPVIMFSAEHSEAKEQRARQSGVYTLLRKPMLPEYVIAAVEQAVNERIADSNEKSI